MLWDFQIDEKSQWYTERLAHNHEIPGLHQGSVSMLRLIARPNLF